MKTYTKAKKFLIYNFSKILRDIVFVVGSRAITYLTGGIWGVLLARWLGTEYFGVYIFWFGLASIFTTIARFGFNTFLTRELSANQIKSKVIFSRYIKLYLIALSFSLISLLMYLFYNEKDANFIFLGVTTVFIVAFENISQTVASWLFSRRKATYVAKISIVKSALTLTTGFAVYNFGFDIKFLLLVPFVFTLLKFLIVFRKVLVDAELKSIDILLAPLDRENLLIIWHKTWSFGLFNIVAAIQVNGDAVILKYLDFTEHDIGILGAALRLKTIVALSSVAITQVVLPKLANDFGVSEGKFYRTFYRVFQPFFVINLLFCMLLIFYNGDIVSILFGEKYIESTEYMLLFSLGMISPLMTLLSSSMIAINKQPFNLKWSIISYSIIPFLKIYLIPIWGGLVIGWIEGVGGWVGFLVMIYFLHRFLKKKMSFKDIFTIVLLFIINIILPYFLVQMGFSKYSIILLFVISLYISIKSKFIDFKILLPRISDKNILMKLQKVID